MSRRINRERLMVSYEEATALIESGDVGLVRGSGLISKVIKIGGRGEHSHAAILGWTTNEEGDHRQLDVAEFREWRGGRSVKFESQLGMDWDIYRPKSSVEVVYYENGAVKRKRLKTDPESTFWQLKSMTGQPYGWGSIKYAAFRHFPIFRWFYPAVTCDESLSRYPPYCSQAVAMSWRETHKITLQSGKTINIDPVPGLADWLTEPTDLARSRLFDYLFTVERQ